MRQSRDRTGGECAESLRLGPAHPPADPGPRRDIVGNTAGEEVVKNRSPAIQAGRSASWQKASARSAKILDRRQESRRAPGSSYDSTRIGQGGRAPGNCPSQGQSESPRGAIRGKTEEIGRIDGRRRPMTCGTSYLQTKLGSRRAGCYLRPFRFCLDRLSAGWRQLACRLRPSNTKDKRDRACRSHPMNDGVQSRRRPGRWPNRAACAPVPITCKTRSTHSGRSVHVGHRQRAEIRGGEDEELTR